jgi:hypothetical protein
VTGPSQACFGPAPADWSSRLTTHPINVASGTTFQPGAVVGSTAFGQLTIRHGGGIGQVDLDTGAVQQLTTYDPLVSGLGAMAADPDWVVWEQGDSSLNPGDWSVHAWRRATGMHTVLATSTLAGGGFVNGPPPFPVLRNGVAVWAQPVPGPGGTQTTQLWAVQLATGQRQVLDSGLVSSPVYAGGYLVWSTGAPGRPTLHAVDANTLAPVRLPTPLIQPGSFDNLSGSPDYLVWSSQQVSGVQDTSTLTAWRLPNGPAVSYTSNDSRHVFQFLQVSGDFVVWFSGTTSTLLDLRTGNGFDLPGTAAVSAQTLAVAQPDPTGGSTISHVSLAGLPRLTACS